MFKLSNLFKTFCLLSLTLPALAADRNEQFKLNAGSEGHLIKKFNTLSVSQEVRFSEIFKTLENYSVQAAYPQEDAEEQYQRGLLYRDGKVEGFQKGSFEAIQWSGFYFQEASIKNHLKAMHNLAMIYYAEKQFDAASYWFVKAALQGFDPSRRNIERLNKEKGKFDLNNLNNPYQFTIQCLPSVVPFEDFGIPDEIFSHVTKYCQLRDLIALTQVDRRWKAISQEAINKRVINFDRMDYIQNNLVKEVSIGNLTRSFSLFESAFELIKNASPNYFYLFLQQAAAITEKKQCTFSGEGKEQDTLKAWSPILGALRQLNASQVDTIINNHINNHINSNASFEGKINIIKFLNQPFMGSWPFNTENNYYYNPSEAKKHLEGLLGSLSENNNDYPEATLFVLRELSPFNRDKDSPLNQGQASRVPLGDMVMKHLGDTGNHWHKILYLAHHSKGYHIEPVFGDLITLDKLKEMFKNFPEALDQAIWMCKDVLGKDFSQNPARLTQDNEAIEFLTYQFSRPTGYKYTNPEADSYLNKAIDDVILKDQVDQAYALFRILSHKGGFIQFFDNHPEITDHVSLQDLLGHSNPSPQEEVVKFHLDRLQSYLKEKNAYTPAFLPVTRLTIQELTELTPEQDNIINLLNEKKERFEKPSFSIQGNSAQYVRSYGASRLHGGSLACYLGGLEAVQDTFVITDNTIIEGPAYIKAKEFTLQADFDALGGAIIVAEKFNLLSGNIWNPQNCHFIKVPKIKMDSSMQILD